MTKILQNLFMLIMSNTTDSQSKKHTSSYIDWTWRKPSRHESLSGRYFCVQREDSENFVHKHTIMYYIDRVNKNSYEHKNLQLNFPNTHGHSSMLSYPAKLILSSSFLAAATISFISSNNNDVYNMII